MRLKNYKKWHADPDMALVLYFAQRLDELFFDYTLDTYKPPALNCIFLCREALELIKDIEDEIIDPAHLDHVLDELKWSLSSDLVAKEILNSDCEKFILRGESIKLNETRIRLEVLERTLNPLLYIEICQDLIVEELVGGSKKKIDHLAVKLASTLVNMGVGKQHIYEQVQNFFFFGEDVICVDDLETFFEKISPTEHHFEIYFVVSNLIRQVEESIETFDLEIISSPPKSALSVAEENGLTPNQDEVWLEVKNVGAFDRHTARKRAEAKLDMVRDLFLLFSHKNRITWRAETVITQCCDDTPILIRTPKNTMEKCFDLKASDASLRLNSMIKTLSLSGNSFVRFHRAVDLHAIGATNELPENQLLNVWIALETLVPSHIYGGGKVVKIKNGIMPILLVNYLPRIIQRLTADLVRWNRQKISRIIREASIDSKKRLYEKVLELLVLPDHKAHLDALYAELGDFHLLRLRVFEVSEIFRKPKKIIDRLNEHEVKVNWQIRRIYRTRNLIVHSGRTIPYVDTLIENAHDYLDQAIDAVLAYSCGILSARSIDQAFDMARMDYEVYMSNLKSISSFDEDNIFFVLNGRSA
ncbi:hypothetical protein SAMN05216601_106142 [Ectopseudomonas composti]|uniref:Apea-like HEPN domain-containing protein n=1 Tax=Ectopseudomonas composti TaxID=658457 RepID=A0A1I5N7Q5_9GAMM|nr:hypothetical protein [Pseudomonas composti]SFP17632.1 hypothetical protein SAMN05216601_106142 [Pseudomonas composti]